jgi:hypothetical protein
MNQKQTAITVLVFFLAIIGIASYIEENPGQFPALKDFANNIVKTINGANSE